MSLEPTPAQLLVYQGTVITERQKMLSLTDMWKAAGSPNGRGPSDWRALPETVRFAEFLAETLNAGKSGNEIFQAVRGGRTPGTWGHWQIGLAYAKYLSSEFHVWCNTVVRDRMEPRHVHPRAVATSLDIDTRMVIGGIAKAVVGKALEERLAPVEAALVAVAGQLRRVMDGFDPRAVVTEFRPMLDILVEEGVQPKKRRALSSRCSKSCLRFCIANGKASAVRESRETKRWLFQQDAIRDWLDSGGRQMIAAHKSMVAGQTVLPFVKPKGSQER